jgi:murein DD-endopeptidase MepM/ murein hydrolase activator NlpD
LLKTRRKKLSALLAVVLAAVAAAVPLLPTAGTPKRQRAANAFDAIPSPAGTVRPHPRVTIALAPGQAPPEGVDPTPGPDPSTTSYPESNPASFRPPSDAEIKRELHQLHVTGVGGYTNPFAHVQGLVPERIDMGVDYAGQGPVVALGSGRVFNTNGAGWPGGSFIGITLDSGPYARLSYFIAEDIVPAVKVGQHVLAGQVIGMMYNGGSGIETGWASGRGDEPLAAALGQQAPGDPGAWTSAAGLSFDRVLVGAGAPSGVPQGSDVHGKMPAGFP